jgi:RHS repeat-associated protein
MNAYQPRGTQTYGYDNTCLSFDPTGTLIFGYDASSNRLITFNVGASPGTAARFRQFTGKERDSESGLDYFGARYYGSALGRFTSPDWSAVPQPVPYADFSNPQTLNQYSYVGNNPLAHADADGHCGLIDGVPCSFSQWTSSLPDRLIRGLKFEANTVLEMVHIGAKFTPSNAEQADAMKVGESVKPEFETALAMAVPGPKSEEVPLGDFHAPGDVPNGQVVVRGGQSEMPPAGEPFSGSQGATTGEAGAGVPHGTIRETTAGNVRANGGTVEVAPERTRSGTMNYQHVNVTEGKPSFGPPKPNPVPRKDRIE